MKKQIECPFGTELSTTIIGAVLLNIKATFEEDGDRWCGFLKSEEYELTGFCIEPDWGVNELTIYLHGNERIAQLIVDAFLKNAAESGLQVYVNYCDWDCGVVLLKYFRLIEVED